MIYWYTLAGSNRTTSNGPTARDQRGFLSHRPILNHPAGPRPTTMSFVLPESFPLYVANRPESPNRDLAVVDKFTGETATRVALADPATIDRAIAAAVPDFAVPRLMVRHETIDLGGNRVESVWRDTLPAEGRTRAFARVEVRTIR